MVDSGLIVREARESDASALTDYMKDLIAENLSTLVLFDFVPTLEIERDFIRRAAQSKNSVLLLAFRESLVGQLHLQGEWQPKRAHSGTFAMSVHREFRGKGVGTALIQALFTWVEGHPFVSRVELEVLSNNPGARRLYERLGFEQEGRRTGAVIHDGTHLDSITMARCWSRKARAHEER